MKKVFYALILSLLLVPALVLGADTLPKALGYIVSMQESNGAYISDAPQQFGKKAKKNTRTTSFVAWALSEARYRI
jgi:hypothetical protein